MESEISRHLHGVSNLRPVLAPVVVQNVKVVLICRPDIGAQLADLHGIALLGAGAASGASDDGGKGYRRNRSHFDVTAANRHGLDIGGLFCHNQQAFFLFDFSGSD
jgi:hypothetical protein